MEYFLLQIAMKTAISFFINSVSHGSDDTV